MSETKHCDTCRCAPGARAADELSEAAVDWLLTSGHVTDPRVHELFRAIENGEITPEEAGQA